MTIDDWLQVGKERGADAEAIVKQRSLSIGSVYVAGYAIECSLKAYLRSIGKAFPTAGPGGHNLTALWKASGFRKRDIGGDDGCSTFFFDTWSTALRYATTIEASGMSAEELVEGAKRIAGWINMQVRRTSLRRRRR